MKRALAGEDAFVLFGRSHPSLDGACLKTYIGLR